MKYTKEITDKLVLDYQSGIAVETLAKALDVPIRSVVAKLSSLGVYRAKEYRDKCGNPVQLKAELVDQIALALAVPPDRLESLEKVTKPVLRLILNHLKLK